MSISTPWFSSTTNSVAPAARALGDRRVHVVGHPRAGPLVVLAPGDDVLPSGDAGDALHVDGDVDAHAGILASWRRVRR